MSAAISSLHRRATAVRIYCPVGVATVEAIRSGRGEAIDADPALAAIVAIVRDDNPLGDFGSYKGVFELALGLESFMPTAAAQPVVGAAGAVATSPTVIVTTYLAADAPEAAVRSALERIVAAHPWEVPVIEMVEISLLVRR